LRRKRRSIGELFWEVVVKAENCAVVDEDVRFLEVELPSEDLEELSLYPIHVSLAENASGESPVDVLQC